MPVTTAAHMRSLGNTPFVLRESAAHKRTPSHIRVPSGENTLSQDLVAADLVDKHDIETVEVPLTWVPPGEIPLSCVRPPPTSQLRPRWVPPGEIPFVMREFASRKPNVDAH